METRFSRILLPHTHNHNRNHTCRRGGGYASKRDHLGLSLPSSGYSGVSGRGVVGGQSLSPPKEEDLAMICTEAEKWADPKAPVSSRKKEVRLGRRREGEADDNKGKAKGGVSEKDGEVVAAIRAQRDMYEREQKLRKAGAPAAPVVSELSRLMSQGSGGAHCQGRVRCMHLKIFCPFLVREGQRIVPMSIKLSDQSNLMDVIRATLRLAREKKPDVDPNPDRYRLRVAEDDTGRPDEDLPVLDKKTALCKTGFDSLVLCYAPATHAEVAPRKTMEDITFQVVYGVDKKLHKKITLPPDLLFKDALSVVCERLKKEANKHTLRPVSDGSEKESLSDKTLGFLARMMNVSELHLKCKNQEDDDFESDPELDTVVRSANMFWDWDEASASRYTEYTVIKINKFGSRQARILGIDREKIYNMMRGTKVQKTKNPERSISDVTIVHTFSDKPCYFEIEYKNSKSGKDQIECQSPMEALEVATKVRFLLNLHKATTSQASINAQAGPGSKTSLMPTASGMDKLLAKITPTVLHSPRSDALRP